VKRTSKTLLVLVLGLVAVHAQAEVTIDTVIVGNPGNAGELSGQSAGGQFPDRISGAVPYAFRMGTYEVTAGQYTEFLNAVAVDDPYLLYRGGMWTNVEGCKIQRLGSAGSYTYSIAPEWANRPVNFVGWGDAARFANWMHNGQPTGPQGPGTTESGSYNLNGATTDDQLLAATRQPGATWVIPSEDEWYKAAYHKNDGVTGNYWDYPTGGDLVPSNDLIDPDPGNNANFYDNGFTIGSPYYRTEVGAFENSASPYGTFDQGGNVWEWNDTTVGGVYENRFSARGGSYQFYYHSYDLHAAFRNGAEPLYHGSDHGFRLALVPEPASLVLLALGGLGVLRRR